MDKRDMEQEKRLIYTEKERDVGDYMAVLCPGSLSWPENYTPCLLNNFKSLSSSCEEENS